MSLARFHFQRTVAAREATATRALPGGVMADTASYGTMAERIAAQLAMHAATLKALKSRTAKIEAKRDMLPDYTAYIDGVIAADAGAQDPVVTTIMLWRLDIGDWDGALGIAAYAIGHRLAMPESFSRDVPTTVLEEIADAALALSEPSATMIDRLQTALELTGDCDMPDEVRAKAHKALGLIIDATDPERAIVHLETALALDPKSGVKTALTRLKKVLSAVTAGDIAGSEGTGE